MPLTPLLFISPRIPWPLDTGAKIRTGALLDALAEHYAIHYVGFLQPELTRAQARERLSGTVTNLLRDEPARGPLGRMWLGTRTLADSRPVTIAKYWNRALAAFVRQWDGEYPKGIIHADHLHMGQYLPLATRALRGLDEHNVESLILERLADQHRGRPWAPYLDVQARRMRRTEAELAAKADVVWAVSAGDAADLTGMAPGCRPEVIPNGVNLDLVAPPAEGRRPQPGRLVFVGSMNWLPNQDAMIWFVGEVLGRLEMRPPRSGPWSLDIVGHSPPATVRALESTRVRVTGGVPDVRPYIHEAEIYVAPIRIGGGSRLKLLEAFAAGIPVVSTSIGCEGLEVEHGRQLLIADDAEGFAEAVDRLASNPRLREELALNARRHVEDHYSWRAIGQRLVACYESRLAEREKTAAPLA